MSIQFITGSLEGTKLIGSFGRITSLKDSDITITSSVLGNVRFTLPKSQYFTDTGAPSTVLNSITEAIVWGEGACIIEGGVSQSIVPIGNILTTYLSNAPNQAQLEGLLTGETITAFDTDGSTYTNFSTSTPYSINDYAFQSDLRSYIDDGNCTTVGFGSFLNNTDLNTISFPGLTTINQQSFQGLTSLSGSISFPELTTVNGLNGFYDCRFTTIDLPKVTSINQDMLSGNPNLVTVNAPLATTINRSAFNSNTSMVSASFPSVTNITELFGVSHQFILCSALTYVYLPSLISPNGLGGNPSYTGVFELTALNGNITVPIAFQTNNAGNPDGDIEYLTGRGWTVTYI